jgi:23S rRNA (guanosine2251-2'-O)-methyltransferase
MGAEGDGLRRLTKERCDALAALPCASEFTTLNVSNAAAVAMYHLTVQSA